MPYQPFFILLIFLAVGLNTVSQVLLKLGAIQNLLNYYLLGGILTYGLAGVFYILVLGKVNLSVVYPTVVGLSLVATTISGALIFREKVYPVNWFGVALMLSSIYIIIFGGKNI